MAKLLLVEDEASVASLLARVLSRAGHSVMTCSTGTEALAAWDESASLAVVDLGLPDMPGEQLVAQLAAAPGVAPIVVSSGTPISADVFGAPEGRVHVLQKPYMPMRLLELVDQLLTTTRNE